MWIVHSKENSLLNISDSCVNLFWFKYCNCCGLNIASGGGALCSVRHMAGIGLRAGYGTGLEDGGRIALGAGSVFKLVTGYIFKIW